MAMSPERREQIRQEDAALKAETGRRVDKLFDAYDAKQEADATKHRHAAERLMTKKPFVKTLPDLIYPIKAVMTLSNGLQYCFIVEIDEHGAPQAALSMWRDRDSEIVKCAFKGTCKLTVKHEGEFVDFHINQTGKSLSDDHDESPERLAEHAEQIREDREDR